MRLVYPSLLKTLIPGFPREPPEAACAPGKLGLSPGLCFPAFHLPNPTGVLETKSSLAVPGGSLLAFMVSKRPLRGFVVILRVHGATLT